MPMKREVSGNWLLCACRMKQPAFTRTPIRQLPSQSLHHEVTVSQRLSDGNLRTFAYVRDLHPGSGLFPCPAAPSVEISRFAPPQRECRQLILFSCTGQRAVKTDYTAFAP